MQRALLFILLLSISYAGLARVSLPRIFSDHMVIQRNKPVHVWGRASPGERVTVTIAFASKSVRTGRNGKWEVFLPEMPSGGPYTLTVSGSNTITFEDVMSGEVWLCSGQSNMEWPLKAAQNAQVEINNARYPLIRHFKVPNKVSFKPKDDVEDGIWEVCSPATAGDFTAVGYFFALELFKELKVPIGLVNASWGGTNVETWISDDAFFSNQHFSGLRKKMPANGDSIALKKYNALHQKVNAIQGSLPDATEERSFTQLNYNDSLWPKMTLPQQWENAGWPDLDGTVWFRKNINMLGNATLADGVLSLGPVDDIDSTFLNGIFIGSTNGWDKPRSYSIKKEMLSAENVLTIKVIDNGGGGGIYGPGGPTLLIGSQLYELSGEWKFKITNVRSSRAAGPNDYPTLLYNGMIHPLTPLPIAGAIWYQGESNTGRASEYKTSFPLMITNWRNKWKDQFPFYFVQLANFQGSHGNNQNGGSTWAELREAQTYTVKAVPKTGMAVTIDIGDSKDIHPANKQDVGKRLAANALAETYARSRIHQGPLFESMQIDGSRIILNFHNTENGWEVRNKYGYINGFEIAGADRQFRYARAYLSGNSIVVINDSISSPVAVRYAWADDPADLNLYNKEGFPAVPFRTDNWNLKTEAVRYDF